MDISSEDQKLIEINYPPSSSSLSTVDKRRVVCFYSYSFFEKLNTVVEKKFKEFKEKEEKYQKEINDLNGW
jgi:hypothetical protein